jgi:hypothetical protein
MLITFTLIKAEHPVRDDSGGGVGGGAADDRLPLLAPERLAAEQQQISIGGDAPRHQAAVSQSFSVRCKNKHTNCVSILNATLKFKKMQPDGCGPFLCECVTFFLLPAQLQQPRPQGQDELVRRAAQEQQLPTPLGAARVEGLLDCFAIMHGANLEFLFLQHQTTKTNLKRALSRNINQFRRVFCVGRFGGALSTDSAVKSPRARHHNLRKFYCWARCDWCWIRNSLDLKFLQYEMFVFFITIHIFYKVQALVMSSHGNGIYRFVIQ